MKAGGKQYECKQWDIKNKIIVQKGKDFKEKERLRSKANYQKLKIKQNEKEMSISKLPK